MNKLISMYIAAELWINNKKNTLLSKEDGAVDIIAIVVLIAIAVVLAIVFKDRISALLDNLFNAADENASEAVAKIT